MWYRAGGNYRLLNNMVGKCLLGGEYQSFNRRAGRPRYNSVSELELEPALVKGYRPGVGIAWVGTGDIYAIVKSYSYISPTENFRTKHQRWRNPTGNDALTRSSG